MLLLKKSFNAPGFGAVENIIARLSILDQVQGTELKVRVVPFINEEQLKANPTNPEANKLHVEFGAGLGSLPCFYLPYNAETNGEARVFAHDEAKRLILEAQNKAIEAHNALEENAKNQLELWLDADIEIVL